jgi:hypothetical protein
MAAPTAWGPAQVRIDDAQDAILTGVDGKQKMAWRLAHRSGCCAHMRGCVVDVIPFTGLKATGHQCCWCLFIFFHFASPDFVLGGDSSIPGLGRTLWSFVLCNRHWFKKVRAPSQTGV